MNELGRATDQCAGALSSGTVADDVLLGHATGARGT